MAFPEINSVTNLFSKTQLQTMIQPSDAESDSSVDFASLINSPKEVISPTASRDTAKSSPDVSFAPEKQAAKNEPKADNSKKPDSKQAQSNKEGVSEKSPAKQTSSKETSQKTTDASSQTTVTTEAKDASSSATAEDTVTMSINEDGTINLESLAYVEGLISFINPETQELTTMSAQDLVQKIASGEVPMLKPEDIKAIDINGKIDISGFEIVEDKVIFTNKEVLADAELVDFELDPASALTKEKAIDGIASKIAELDNEGKKEEVKLDVSVKEEKVAPSIEKSLVVEKDTSSKSQDKTQVQVQAQAQTQSQETSLSPISSSTEQGEKNPITQPQTTQAPVQQEFVLNAPDASQTAKVDTASSASLSQASVATTESVSSLRTEQSLQSRFSNQDTFKGLSKEVVEQIKVNITKSAVKGVDKIDIQLKPQDLGNVEVKLQIGKDGKLQAQIIASRADVAETMQKDMQSLEKAFSDAGFDLDENSLSFQFKEDSQNDNDKNALRAFIGEVLDEDAVSQGYNDNSWDGKSALNIRV